MRSDHPNLEHALCPFLTGMAEGLPHPSLGSAQDLRNGSQMRGKKIFAFFWNDHSKKSITLPSRAGSRGFFRAFGAELGPGSPKDKGRNT